jgi:hypothetical protein
MTGFRITFSRVVMGVPFPVACVTIRHAWDAERALRAAELRLMRRTAGLDDWRHLADRVDVEPCRNAAS